MTDKGYCAESSGQAICGKLIQLLKFGFLLSVRSPFVWFSSGHLSLTLVQTSSGIFVKRTILLIYWNEIKDFYSVSSVLINDLVFLFLCPHLLLHLLYSENYIKY
jgi:hypothetical protein